MFLLGGPKNYTYETSSGKTVCKIRGFSLKFKNSTKLNYQSVMNMVKNIDQLLTIPICSPTKITRDVKNRKVINKSETKLYKIIYTKRKIVEDYKTLPFGF